MVSGLKLDFNPWAEQGRSIALYERWVSPGGPNILSVYNYLSTMTESPVLKSQAEAGLSMQETESVCNIIVEIVIQVSLTDSISPY